MNMNDAFLGSLIFNKDNGGGGSGGHTILDDEGTSLTQRDDLQFKGAYSEDDSTNDKTVVNVARTMTLAEFEQLTDDEKAGFINITDITSGSDDRFQPVIYSEEEREIGVWLDGKPLYEKTVYSAGGTSGEIYIPHGVSNLEQIVYAEGVCADSDATPYNYYPFSRISNDGFNIGISVTTTGAVSVYIPSVFQQRIVDIYVTIRYTKTTDQAGSGQWTPQGVPAHHYSTDEQVIGTWINGKTLYEKTWYFQSSMVPIYRQWTPLNIDVSDLDMEEIVDHRAQSYSTESVSIDVWNDHGTLKAQYWMDGLNIGSVTIRYTKTSI